MCDAKLVQVVHVRDAKVEWGEEDDLASCEVGKDVERDDAGSPYNLLAHRALILSDDESRERCVHALTTT